MGIAPISGSSGSAYMSYGTDNGVKLLEKQKNQLLDQMQKVKESSMDSRMKQDKIKELNEQITEIEAQIWQKKMEKLNPDSSQDSKAAGKDVNKMTGEKKQGASGNDEGKGGVVNSEHMLSAVSGYSMIETLDKVRTDLLGQLRIATSSGKNPEAGKGIEARLQKVESDIMKKASDIKDDLKQAAKESADAVPENAADKIDQQDQADHTEQTVQSSETDKENGSDIANQSEKQNLKSQSVEGKQDLNHRNRQETDRDESLINDKHSDDPLMWLLENNVKYEKVDLLI